jgi:hypothetical protein
VTSSRGGRGRDARAPVKGRRAACGRGRPRTQGRVRGRCLRPREGAQGCVRAGRPRTQGLCLSKSCVHLRLCETPAHPGGRAEEMPAPQAGGRRRCLRIRDGAALRAGETSAPLAYKGRFLASPCVPSPISAVRTPKLPLLPVWEKGVGGMRGKGARECRTLLISHKNSTLASRGDEGQKHTGM